jgi:hypothetical protein
MMTKTIDAIKTWTAAAVLLTLAAAPLRASGLRTPFGEVVVRHLKIGQTYSMYKLVNLPLRVVNTGRDTVYLTIEPVRISTGEARRGYEPVPDLAWVRVAKSSFTVAPNREAATDLIISIPNDASLLGRRFEADIWSHTQSARGTVAVGLQSRLLMQIDSTPPNEEELKQKYVDAHLANLDFTILPTNNEIGGVVLGRKLDLRADRKIAIKLINPNDRALDFRVRSLPVWESGIDAPDGYEAAENPQWLTPDQGVVKVAPNSIGDTSLTLDIPDEPRYRGRHFFFVVSFEVLEQKIPTRVFYRLMVATENAASSK